MKNVAEIVLIFILLIVAYQDYKFRAVWWVLFPIISVLSLLFNEAVVETVYNSLINWVFIGVQLLLLTLYFSIKYKRLINITDSFLGWGDILFLFSVSFLFSPAYFITFYVGSLIVSFAFVLLFLRLSSENSIATIPLAGIQACVLTVIILLRIFNYSSQLLRGVLSGILFFFHA